MVGKRFGGKRTVDGERDRTDPQKLNRVNSIKIKLVGAILILAFVLLSGRVAYIQVVYGDEFTRRAIVQQVMDSPTNTERIITPNRGAILDRNSNMQALAISSTVYNIFIDPYRILDMERESQEEIFDKIYMALGIPVSELREIVNTNPDSQHRVIAWRVNLATKEAMRGLGASHVHFVEETQRHYPGGHLAASLIGFIQGNGVWGLERMHNTALTGTAGRELRMRDANNNAITQTILPVEGNTLITTLDLMIQQEAQRLVTYYASQVRAQNAALIVANPNTGEIIAMAEYPSFDLNDPFNVERINSEATRARIMELPEERWLEEMFRINRNFSVVDTFEPGSVFKPLIFAAAIEEGVIGLHETFFCGGGRQIMDTFIPCWTRSCHGHQTFVEALANSCNPAVMYVAARLGRERYYRYQSDFGIGRPTGIDLPGEPNTERLIHSLSMLNPVELAAASMGQGFNITSMQMLTSFASLVNGGYLMQPFVVSQIVDENGNVVHSNEPTIARKVISEEVSDIMRIAMVDAMEWGTGRRAGIPGHLIGGKTGTAQQGLKVPENTDEVHALITYFPADNPQYIIMSVISLPEIIEFGNAKTLPMVRDMTNFIITHRQIEAHDREAFNRVLVDNSLHIVDYVGRNIAEVTSSLNSLGLTYDISGSGDIVRGQFPSPGSRVNRGSMVHLTLEMSSPDIELTMVPNVMGLHYAQAVEIIRSVGLVPVVEHHAQVVSVDDDDDDNNGGSNETPAQAVINQFPRNEIRVPERTQILIYVE